MDENPYAPPAIPSGESDPRWRKRPLPRFAAAACGGLIGSGMERVYEMVYLGKEFGDSGVVLAVMMIAAGAVCGYLAFAIVQMRRVRQFR